MGKYDKKKSLSYSSQGGKNGQGSSKKKSFSSVLLDVFFYGVMGITIAVSARKLAVYSNSYIKNDSIIPEVAHELTVDLSILHNDAFNDQIVKLKPNNNNKVYVCVDNNVSARAKKNIANSLNYFNDIFDNINDRYNFELCDKATEIANRALANSTIHFDYKDTGNLVYGATYRNFNKPVLLKAIDKNSYYSNVYSIHSNISLNQQYFDKLSDFTQESIIRHELLHVLGIEDTYVGFKEEASLLNVNYTSVINKVSPKDLARLYVLYDEALIADGNKINQAELARVKERISDYEKGYYAEVAKIVKNKLGKTDYKTITNDDIVGFTTIIDNIELTIGQNGQFSYTSSKGDKGTRSIIKGSNYIVLPDIKNGNYEDFYVILKDENGLQAYNMSIFHGEGNDKISPIEDNSFEITQ